MKPLMLSMSIWDNKWWMSVGGTKRRNCECHWQISEQVILWSCFDANIHQQCVARFMLLLEDWKISYWPDSTNIWA
jgi:hypothetical protein